MAKPYTYKKALTIAGSDSGGGAGIQADLKAFSANAVYGMSALTAITAQNTQGVYAIHPVPVPVLEKQISVVVNDIGADAVKIGMLHSAEVIKAVLRAITSHSLRNIVVDPVMVATSGDKLLQDSAIESLINELLPAASLITPNIPEAEIITGRKISDRKDFMDAAKALGDTGAEAILLKSGHFNEDTLVDVLYIPGSGRYVEMPYPRLDTLNTHGTGCTLSSAIAAFLARDYELEVAVKKGVEYVHKALAMGAPYKIGEGHGPVHHFYNYWN